MSSAGELWQSAVTALLSGEPRPGLHPIPGTKPITIEAIILPPLMYYIALLFLPPPPPKELDTLAIKLLRNTLAIAAGLLFFRMPLAYHIPQSIGLNYQLSLVGLYGGGRVLDSFFISPMLFNHIPRRVRYEHKPHTENDNDQDASNEPDSFKTGQATTNEDPVVFDRRPSLPLDTYTFSPRETASAIGSALARTLSGPKKRAVYQYETTEDGWPHSFLDRASWALELELSMRGMGFTETTADVRHTKKTWLPSIHNRLHSIFVHVVPVMAVCLFVIRGTYDDFLAAPNGSDPPPFEGPSRFDTRLSMSRQLLLTAALGAFLMVAFSFAHSVAAIACAPLAPSPFAFFPPLYTTPIWEIESVRRFWGWGWHRLFARLFLVYGVWPGQWVERVVMGKRADEPADLGKVLGGFLSSAFVHSFSVRSVLGGDWYKARGEAIFFATNGLAVVVEEVVIRAVLAYRKKRGCELYVWYDAWIGRLWWVSVLLYSGRNFARGWVDAGLVREMAGR